MTTSRGSDDRESDILGAWAQALAWADELATLALVAEDPRSCDHRATAGIIATTAYALARHDQLPHVRTLGLDRLIYPLFDENNFVAWGGCRTRRGRAQPERRRSCPR
ncbi:MAG TPA: hypothetical protein VG247_34720 [Pseudonocardiaceae bacterium]|jgi:hypothetical protein|nr:hypothetical protein [Pseudonocardiaceae bacterium]